MAYSIFPLVNYLVWLGLRGRADALDGKNEAAFQELDNGSQTLSNVTWKKTSSAEKAQTGSWFAATSIFTLVLIMYAPVLISLARQWWDDPNYGHGFFVPIFAGYVLWSERDQWGALTNRPNNFGLVIMLFAIGLRVLGMLGAELFMARLSLVILIAGIVLFMAGRRVLRTIAFPIGYLLFMIPLPAIVYYQLTLPLQLLASRLGATGLVTLGIRTVRQGNLLLLPNCTLNVVEACSGIRSLLSLLAAVVAYGYLAEPSTWKRSLLAVASIPIAIATNGLRLVATGVLSYYFGPSVDTGAVHLALGISFIALAFLSILVIHKMLGLPLRHQNPARVSL
ncbi:MAG TPA: exosortase/archaeosortase family protein [Candidatus Acidoferrum sp.]|nr:exosortase/archaeosortase family protein [Candidatus Acidoferrum sp.]